MTLTFLPDKKIKTPAQKPTAKDLVCEFWKALEKDRYKRYKGLSFREYMRLPKPKIVKDFRRILTVHKVPDPEKLELDFLKLRELYRRNPPTPN